MTQIYFKGLLVDSEVLRASRARTPIPEEIIIEEAIRLRLPKAMEEYTSQSWRHLSPGIIARVRPQPRYSGPLGGPHLSLPKIGEVSYYTKAGNKKLMGVQVGVAIVSDDVAFKFSKKPESAAREIISALEEI